MEENKPDLELETWKCRNCGKCGNTLPYCSNCGKSQHEPPSFVVTGSLVAVMLVGAGIVGTCAVNGLSDQTQISYWGASAFKKALSCSGLMVLAAIAVIWRYWRRTR